MAPLRQMRVNRSLGGALDGPPDDIIAEQPREVHATRTAQRRVSKMRLAHLKSFILFLLPQLGRFHVVSSLTGIAVL